MIVFPSFLNQFPRYSFLTKSLKRSATYIHDLFKHEYLRSRASRCLSLSSSSGVLEIHRDTRAYVLDLASKNLFLSLLLCYDRNGDWTLTDGKHWKTLLVQFDIRALKNLACTLVRNDKYFKALKCFISN